ncbi:hypothetical protein ON010_g19055 [Phytophthora cinnamomi]|nr:hypothetical protein ON010_g19055 [Phytophthora cinnamomi]
MSQSVTRNKHVQGLSVRHGAEQRSYRRERNSCWLDSTGRAAVPPPEQLLVTGSTLHSGMVKWGELPRMQRVDMASSGSVHSARLAARWMQKLLHVQPPPSS